MAFLALIVRTFETFYFQKKDGSFDRRLFDAWMVQCLDLLASHGSREFWALRKHQFSAEFVEYMGQQIATVTAKPMYPDNA